jgi:hypothetical protein
VSERLNEVTFIAFLALCTGILLAVCGLVWLIVGGEYEEDPEDELP